MTHSDGSSWTSWKELSQFSLIKSISADKSIVLHRSHCRVVRQSGAFAKGQQKVDTGGAIVRIGEVVDLAASIRFITATLNRTDFNANYRSYRRGLGGQEILQRVIHTQHFASNCRFCQAKRFVQDHHTLIALLYIAEHDYSFQSMQMDVSTFEKGQYGPLFDAMMATEEPMMGSIVTLTPATVQGEDSACTALRAELDSFFYTALTADMTMMGSGS